MVLVLWAFIVHAKGGFKAKCVQWGLQGEVQSLCIGEQRWWGIKGERLGIIGEQNSVLCRWRIVSGIEVGIKAIGLGRSWGAAFWAEALNEDDAGIG